MGVGVGQVPQDLFVPEASSGDEDHQRCHLCWWRHPTLPNGHHPCLLLKGCPMVVGGLEGQELPLWEDWGGGQPGLKPGKWGAGGYIDKQHPSLLPPRAPGR